MSPAMTKTAADFDPEVMKLFDQYVHGAIDRRGFITSASKYAVGGVSATMLLEMLSPNFAAAQQVKKEDPRIVAKTVESTSGTSGRSKWIGGASVPCAPKRCEPPSGKGG